MTVIRIQSLTNRSILYRRYLRTKNLFSNHPNIIQTSCKTLQTSSIFYFDWWNSALLIILLVYQYQNLFIKFLIKLMFKSLSSKAFSLTRMHEKEGQYQSIGRIFYTLRWLWRNIKDLRFSKNVPIPSSSLIYLILFKLGYFPISEYLKINLKELFGFNFLISNLYRYIYNYWNIRRFWTFRPL